jgi:hypothetical protein
MLFRWAKREAVKSWNKKGLEYQFQRLLASHMVELLKPARISPYKDFFDYPGEDGLKLGQG